VQTLKWDARDPWMVHGFRVSRPQVPFPPGWD
jgi:hypothetical protein